MLKFKLTRVDNSYQDDMAKQILERFKNYTESDVPFGWYSQSIGDELFFKKGMQNIEDFLFPSPPVKADTKKISQLIDSDKFYRNM